MRFLFLGLAWLLGLVARISIVAMVGLIVADVVMRNFLNRPLYGTYEIVEMLLVPVAFFFVPDRLIHNGHIAVELIDGVLSRRVLAWLKVVAAALMVLFLVLLSIFMLPPLQDIVKYDRRTFDLELPIIWRALPLYAVMVASAVVACWVLLRQLREAIVPGSVEEEDESIETRGDA